MLQQSKAHSYIKIECYDLSSAEKHVLSKGLNFAPAPCKIPTGHMVAVEESGLRCLPEEATEPARNKIRVLSARRAPYEHALTSTPHHQEPPER